MCGRCSQYRAPWEYLQPIGLHVPLVGGTDPESVGRFNVAPRSKVRILHLEPDGLRWNFVPWGWAPFWAKGTRPPAINARSETAATGKFFKQIWETGRCVIPADGWYEWVKNPDDPKQKYASTPMMQILLTRAAVLATFASILLMQIFHEVKPSHHSKPSHHHKRRLPLPGQDTPCSGLIGHCRSDERYLSARRYLLGELP